MRWHLCVVRGSLPSLGILFPNWKTLLGISNSFWGINREERKKEKHTNNLKEKTTTTQESHKQYYAYILKMGKKKEERNMLV
mmetsp:Transcript_21906/g.33431  ORF Transcript_21906/g.33431 Transcript_21906/m.33431 type:complete len:82 (-) Transcript_21906:25-270(-)